MTSIGRPSTDPPKSSTAISLATRLPMPPTCAYGPATSLSRPILTGLDEVCARSKAGRASGVAASAPSATRRVIIVMFLLRSDLDAIEARRRVMEQCSAFVRGRTGGDSLERIPQYGIA